MKLKHLFFALIVLVACENLKSGADGVVTGKTGSITRFAVSGDYMYALDLNQILVFKVMTNGETKLVNKVPADFGLETIIIYDKTVYVGSTSALYILDITIPESPEVLSITQRDITLIGGCDPVVVKGNYAYSTVKIIENRCGQINETSQLIVYDVTDKTNPSQVNTFPMNEPNGLGYEGDYLFVCDEGDDRVHILNIEVPTNPAYFGFIELTDPVDLIPNDGTMIVSTKDDFVIYDIQDINNIVKLSTIPKR